MAFDLMDSEWLICAQGEYGFCNFFFFFFSNLANLGIQIMADG